MNQLEKRVCLRTIQQHIQSEYHIKVSDKSLNNLLPFINHGSKIVKPKERNKNDKIS